MRPNLKHVASILHYTFYTTELVFMGCVAGCFRAKMELVLQHTERGKEHFSCSVLESFSQ